MKNCTRLPLKWRPALLLLLACCWSIAALAQQTRNITGKITGETGEGLPGVTVLVKGTNTGTTTDPNGSYALQLPAGANTLVISFVGYTTQEVTVNNRTVLNIRLQPDAKALSEVHPPAARRQSPE
jgi:hypothetical protein